MHRKAQIDAGRKRSTAAHIMRVSSSLPFAPFIPMLGIPLTATRPRGCKAPLPSAMRIALLLLVVLCAPLACQVRSERGPASGIADSARAGAAVPTPTPQPPLASASSSAALDPALDTTCAAIAKIARDTLHIAVERDAATTFPAPREDQGSWRGCRFSGKGVIPPSSPGSMPDGRLQGALTAAAWTQDLAYSADGPDGTELAMRRGDVLCHLGIAYQGVVIPDSPNDPPPSAPAKPQPYTLEIRCARNPAPPS
jgi:hypothetical protein